MSSFGNDISPPSFLEWPFHIILSDLQSMQFTINRVIVKLFGPMSQNCYQEVSHYIGIKSVKELI